MAPLSKRARKKAAARERAQREALRRGYADPKDERRDGSQSVESGAEHELPPANPQVIPDVVPALRPNVKGQYRKPDQTPSWRIVLEFAVFFVGVYAVVTYTGQWNAARDANQISSDNFKRAQRAWVNADFRTPVFRLGDAATPLTYAYVIRNFGSSPALNVRVDTLYKIVEGWPDWRVLQADTEALAMKGPAVPLLNGQEIPIGGPIVNNLRILSDTERDDIERDVLHPIIRGKITYEDIFDKPHETTFCVYFQPRNIDPHQTGGGWRACPVTQIAN